MKFDLRSMNCRIRPWWRGAGSMMVAAFILPLSYFILSPVSADAQFLSHGDLFGPGAPPPMIGIEVGLGKHAQQGTFNANCFCTFQNGTGTGFMGSLVFEVPLDYEWAIGVKGGIDFKNTTSTTPVFDTVVISATGSQNDTLPSLLINRIGDVKTTYLALSPYIQYQFFRMGPFVQAGPTFGFLMANHFTHTRQMTSTSVGSFSNLRFASNGTEEETVQDDPITNVNSLRIGLLISAGYNISISERSVLSPLLSYDFPLTSLRSDASGVEGSSGWKIGSLYASAVLKFKLD